MINKPSPGSSGAVHFPTSAERGPFPFPTSKSMGKRKAAAAAEPEPSAEELRLMADTMPGEGPGD
jgi:hypothetical protein